MGITLYCATVKKKKWRKVCFTDESHCRRLPTILRGCFMAEEGVSSVLWQSVHLLNILPPTRLPKPTPLLLPRTQPASKNDVWSLFFCDKHIERNMPLMNTWERALPLYGKSLCVQVWCTIKEEDGHGSLPNVKYFRGAGQRYRETRGGGDGETESEKNEEGYGSRTIWNLVLLILMWLSLHIHVMALPLCMCVCTLWSSILPITSALTAHDQERVGPYQWL